MVWPQFGGTAAGVGVPSQIAVAQSPPATGQPLAPTDLQSAVACLRGQFLRDFDEVENVVVPWFLVSTFEGERLSLPMIDVKFTEMHCRMVFGDCLAKAGGPIQQMTSQSFFRLWRSAGRIVAIRGHILEGAWFE
jgi:hypothetical protein